MTALSVDTIDRADPYPGYEQARQAGRVHWSEPDGAWLVTGWHEVIEVLRDPSWSADHRHATGHDEWSAQRQRATGLPDMAGQVLLFMEPPDHTRLRTLVSKAFTPRTVQRLRARVTDLVDRLLEPLEPGASVDLIAEFAYPLPVAVIAELLGIPERDWPLFRNESARLAPILDWQPPPERLAGVGAALEAIGGYLYELIQDRRRCPADDLLSELVAAEEAGDHLAEDELLRITILLFVAGHETTMNLLGNGTLALLRHPRQLAALAASGDDQAAGMVDELLRYDSPVQLTARTSLRRQRLAGVEVEPGQRAVLLLGAANRDPARFAAPHRLELDRTDGGHLAFGHGAHFCLGAGLARLEGQIAFPRLAQRLTQATLTEDPPEWRDTLTLRGLRALRLEL